MKRKNLELLLQKDTHGKTTVLEQYTAQPLMLSRSFYPESLQRLHLYKMSSSPGLLAGDNLALDIELLAGAHLCLQEQSASKVHPMPSRETQATLHYTIRLGVDAHLEFLAEPIILFAQASLEQNTLIICAEGSSCFWSEIIVPGRMARGEYYDFFQYKSRLKVLSVSGDLWCIDSLFLRGKDQDFYRSQLWADGGILGTAFLILPERVNLNQGQEKILAITEKAGGVRAATSLLPYDKGLVIRAIASGSWGLKNYFHKLREGFREIAA